MTLENTTSQRFTPKTLTAAISAICAGIPLSQAQESAQEDGQDAGDGLVLEEILVTATKRGALNLQDVPMMNKALRFAKESDPVRYQQKQDMIVEINRLRAENRYELYKPYYEVELNKQKLLEQEKQKQAQEKTKGFDGPSFGF